MAAAVRLRVVAPRACSRQQVGLGDGMPALDVGECLPTELACAHMFGAELGIKRLHLGRAEHHLVLTEMVMGALPRRAPGTSRPPDRAAISPWRSSLGAWAFQ